MADAADAAPMIIDHHPTACEGLDRRIVDVVRRTRGDAAVPPLPRGDGWLLVELAGDDTAELHVRADALLAAAGALDGFIITDRAETTALWKIREDGAGLAGISLTRPAYPGWEDAAVPAEHLGSYLRDFDRLLSDHGFDGLPYGHFGDGCVHVRIDFPLTEGDGAEVYQTFVKEAAQLVAGYGGSLSGRQSITRMRRVRARPYRSGSITAN
jgi:FAD/FMN-containing dehydrogenase